MDFVSARLNMVESQVRTNDVTDVDIVDAMRSFPRERFCPPGREHLAYAEAEIEYAPGHHLLNPRDLGKLLFSARPQAGQRALAIGAPYAAALMGRMGVNVTALESAEHDTRVRMALDGERVTVIGGDLKQPPEGPFDLIIAEGAVTKTPDSWIAALAPGGRLAVIERTGPLGKAQLYLKSQDGNVGRRMTFDATPPYVAGFEPEAGFVF
jgi:protein-L-isoaspartate(D-aspartate) O-methyltransferase